MVVATEIRSRRVAQSQNQKPFEEQPTDHDHAHQGIRPAVQPQPFVIDRRKPTEKKKDTVKEKKKKGKTEIL